MKKKKKKGKKREGGGGKRGEEWVTRGEGGISSGRR